MSREQESAEAVRPERRRPARERILRAAARRFYQEGVTATGIDTITAEDDYTLRITTNGPVARTR